MNVVTHLVRLDTKTRSIQSSRTSGGSLRRWLNCCSVFCGQMPVSMRNPLMTRQVSSVVSATEKIRNHVVRRSRPVTKGFRMEDRKSTRLNSSHQIISYAVFCLKKKKKTTHPEQ